LIQEKVKVQVPIKEVVLKEQNFIKNPKLTTTVTKTSSSGGVENRPSRSKDRFRQVLILSK